MLRLGALRIGAMLALIMLGLLAGATLNFAPAFLAIPISLVVLTVILLARWGGHRKAPTEEHGGVRNRLGAERIEFTERDRRTLSDEPRHPGRREDRHR